ncbi:MAG: hypothetical protein HY914_20380 [Desulfomonile tiedjei]|nr:hypothetical protein [Desulfomonile tiedjei]
MNRQTSRLRFRRLMVVIVAFGLVSWSWPDQSYSQGSSAGGAVVEAVEGQAAITRDDGQDEKNLGRGSSVNPWELVTTREKSKLLLGLERGPLVSMGEFSSVTIAPEQDATRGGEIPSIQVVEGVVRATRRTDTGAQPHPFSIATPVVSIRPESDDQPVDVVVEVYDPATTVVTVVSGNVKIRNLTTGDQTERTLTPCSTVYVDREKTGFEPIRGTSSNVNRLIEQSTITGTVYADASACERPAVATQPPPEPLPEAPPLGVSPGVGYPGESYWYVQNWDFLDSYLDEPIDVRPIAGGFYFIIPEIGECFVPYPVGVTWVVDPVVVVPYIRYVCLGRAIHHYRHWVGDLGYRERELLYLASMYRRTHHWDRWWEVRRDLDHLRFRRHWAESRIASFEKKGKAFESDQRRFANRVPRGLNLADTVANSFNNPRNIHAVQNFTKQMTHQENVVKELAGVSQRNLQQMRSKLVAQRDPAARLAMRTELAKLRTDLDRGKLPISNHQTQLKGLVTKLEAERDPAAQKRLNAELSGELKKFQPATREDVLNPNQLTSLKQAVAAAPDPANRQRLQSHFAELEKLVETRKHDDATKGKIQELNATAAAEKDLRKRTSILNDAADLSKRLLPREPGKAGLPAGPSALVPPTVIPKPGERGPAVQQPQEEQKKQTDLMRQQQEEKARSALQQQRLDKERQQQLQLQEEQKKQTDLMRQQQEDKARSALQQQRLDKERQQQLHRQEEQKKQTDLMRQQQEDKARSALQKQRLDKERQQQLQLQEEQKKQTDLMRQQQEDKSRKALQQQRLNQESQLQQQRQEEVRQRAEKMKREQEERKWQADRLQQQEQTRRQEQIRLQQQQQQQLQRQQQLRLQEQQQQQERIRQQQLQRQQFTPQPQPQRAPSPGFDVRQQQIPQQTYKPPSPQPQPQPRVVPQQKPSPPKPAGPQGQQGMDQQGPK